MSKMKLTVLMVLAFMAVTVAVTVQDAYAADKKIYARKTIGQIHEMDMTERTAVISGFRYYFGSSVYGDASKVKLLGYNSGSFEMLNPGMKLRLTYAEYGTNRYVVLAEQLPDATDLNDLILKSQLLNE
jgi:hypothetical protein